MHGAVRTWPLLTRISVSVPSAYLQVPMLDALRVVSCITNQETDPSGRSAALQKPYPGCATALASPARYAAILTAQIVLRGDLRRKITCSS